MTVANVVLADHLFVGLPAIFQVDAHRQRSPRFKTRVRGWHLGTYIFLDRPKANDQDFVQVYLQQECVVRFLTKGIAVGFKTTVLDTGFSRFHPQVSILWPSEIITLPTREHVRVEVSQHCMIELEGGVALAGVLQDLTANGCRLLMDSPLEDGARLRVSCQLEEALRLSECEAEVLGTSGQGDQHLVRCRLCPEHADNRAALETFLSSRQSEVAA